MMREKIENKIIGRIITAAFCTCVICMSATAVFAGEEIMLKDVNSTNYDKYVKTVKAAYGYNRGECNRPYLPHEEHFYDEYYDHWNVDVVYDSSLIKKLYTDFENSRPVIENVKKCKGGTCICWKRVKGAEKYIISQRQGGGKWKVLDTVNGKTCSYIDESNAGASMACSYRIRGTKHVRLWDVKTQADFYCDGGYNAATK